MSRKWRNWYQNKVDEEIEAVDSRDKVKHNERSDQLFLTMSATNEITQQTICFSRSQLPLTTENVIPQLSLNQMHRQQQQPH